MNEWTLTRIRPKWSKADQLRSNVPWLWDSDFDEGRRAWWDLAYAGDLDVASCWPVTILGQEPQELVLVLRASRGNGNDGGHITLAIGDSPQFDIYAKEVFAMQPAQGNSRRARKREDWWR